MSYPIFIRKKLNTLIYSLRFCIFSIIAHWALWENSNNLRNGSGDTSPDFEGANLGMSKFIGMLMKFSH